MCVQWHRCHSWRDLSGRRVSAMTFTVILVLFSLAVLALAVCDRRARRAAGLSSRDSYPGHITDLGPDTARIREEVWAIAPHERSTCVTRGGFPGPGWIGVR